ncbi:MAG: FGGY family carbohydrate kinase, partial [Pseudomonadales bacterium]
MSSVMGIDLGTQSIKVLIYDCEKRQVEASASSPFEMISRDDGSREQLAQWWLDGFRDCMAQLPKELIASVAAIGVSGQQHGFVPVDVGGEVLAPVKLWCDTATVDECKEITRAVGGEQLCIDLAGNPIAAGYTASKILWLKKNNPVAYNALWTILLPHDYFNFFLTGKRTMEYGDASGTGLLDVRARAWSPELVKALDDKRDLLDCLPKLVAADQPVG